MQIKDLHDRDESMTDTWARGALFLAAVEFSSRASTGFAAHRDVG
jgi:hypothetical protein